MRLPIQKQPSNSGPASGLGSLSGGRFFVALPAIAEPVADRLAGSLLDPGRQFSTARFDFRGTTAMEGTAMLVLSRKSQEAIVVGKAGLIVVRVLAIRSNAVTLGIEAPACVQVHRSEVYEDIRRHGKMNSR